MIRLFQDASTRRECLAVLGLLGAIGLLTLFQFTRRTPQETERRRAQVILRGVFDLQQAHFEETGTYLPISRGDHSEILLLAEAPGAFQFRVELTPSGFVAFAEADLDGDGRLEIWRVDDQNSDPVKVQED